MQCTDPNQKICPSNWYDIVGFGGQDGLVAALAVQAMHGLAELSDWLGNETGAAKYRTLHQRGVSAYNDLMWDVERGAFGDWIDTAGRRRFYLYCLRHIHKYTDRVCKNIELTGVYVIYTILKSP